MGVQQYEAYCPRDSVTVIGDTIIEGAMSLRARYHETFMFNKLFKQKSMEGARWLSCLNLCCKMTYTNYNPGETQTTMNHIRSLLI